MKVDAGFSVGLALRGGFVHVHLETLCLELAPLTVGCVLMTG
jgi:hypothetical protein